MQTSTKLLIGLVGAGLAVLVLAPSSSVPPSPPTPKPRPIPRQPYPVGSVVKARFRLGNGMPWPEPLLFKIVRNVPGEGTTDNQGRIRQYAVQEADCLICLSTWFIDDEDIVL